MVGIIVFIVFLIIIIILAWKSWVIVPEQYNYALEWLGKQVGKLEPGFHFIPLVRLGWFYKTPRSIWMVEWPLKLFDSNKSGVDGKKNKVDFSDISTFVSMYALVKVIDPIKAMYSAENLAENMENALEAASSNLLAVIPSTSALAKYGEFSLGDLAKAYEPDNSSLKKTGSDFDWDNLKPDWKAKKEDPKEPKLIKLFKRWGVEILNVGLSDVHLPDDITKSRQEVALADIQKNVAEKQQEVEKIKADTNLMMEKKKAEGKKFEAELLAHVSAFEVQELKKQNPGMTIDQALELIVSKAKWAAIKEGNAQLILSDGSTASEGAKFGAGFHSSKKS